MSLLPSFSVDPVLSEALVDLEREFVGVKVEVSASGDASDSESSSPTVSSGEESEEDSDYCCLEAGFDMAAATTEYFDEDPVNAEVDAPQAAAADNQLWCRKKCFEKFDGGDILHRHQAV